MEYQEKMERLLKEINVDTESPETGS